jgi:uncharacterized protein
MTRKLFAVLCIALILVLSQSSVGIAASSHDTAVPARAKHKVLYLTHSAGFKHDVLPVSETILKEIGDRSGAFEVTATQDCSMVSREGLKQYDAVVFYTTGELPFSDDQKAALLDFVKSGKGFVGIHSATDTFYKWPEYGEMIGGYFNDHPWHQDVTVNVEDTKHPATKHLGKSFQIKDEIYQFKDFSRERVHVLLSLDTNSVDLTKPNVHRTDKDFALAWCRNYGKGRVFYSALGHREEVWRDPRYQQFILGGLKWAMGEK